MSDWKTILPLFGDSQVSQSHKTGIHASVISSRMNKQRNGTKPEQLAVRVAALALEKLTERQKKQLARKVLEELEGEFYI